MNRKEVVLDSGIKLVMVNTDKFKTVDVRVFFEDDLNSRNITTNNLLLKLLSTKTKKYPSRKLFKDYLKDLYDMKIKVSEASYGEVFSFSIGVNSLNSRYTLNNENLLENEFIVLSEVLNNPLVNDNSFDNDYFNEMYKDYKESLIDLENYKEVVVKKKVNEILKDEKCLFELTDGTLNDLKDVTNEEVFKKYLSLNKMCKEVVVLGEINFDDVERYCKKYLNLSRERACFSYLCENKMNKYENYCFDSKFNQSSIAVLFDIDVYVGDELYYPTVLFIELLNYYLFKIVREEHNFCYSIYTSYIASRGLCYLQSNIESKNYEMTLKLIDEIISDLREKIDPKVMDICKNKIINSLKKEDDSPLKQITREYFSDLYNLKGNDEIISIIENISDFSVIESAKRLEKKFSVILKEGN